MMSSPGTEDTLLSSPPPLRSMLITWIGRPAETNNCHLPVPFPKLPSNSNPDVAAE